MELLEKHFGKVVILLLMVLAPPVLFVLTGHEDAAGAYAFTFGLLFWFYGIYKIISDF